MTGRGVDQVLPHPGDPGLREPVVDDARDYVELAEAAHGPVPAPVDFDYVWGDALSVLAREGPGAIVVNLETSVTTSCDFWPSKGIHYRMHPANVECLAAARVDVCCLANNHVLDFGRAGLVETIGTLESAGIAYAGAGRDLDAALRPARVGLPGGGALLVFGFGTESSGIPTAWAAAAERPGVSLLHDLSEATADGIVARVRRTKRAGDIVVASVHWGGNWGYEVPAEHVRFAHRLVEGGVDVVHGHSSHHVRPIEVHRGKLILYGCGDLLTDYEGIRGHERWRGDLGVMYLATVATEDGSLVDLRMAPLQMNRMRLARVAPSDAAWLAGALNRICEPFGTRVDDAKDGTIGLRTVAPRTR